MKLSDYFKCEIALGSAPFATPSWTDFTDDLRACSMTRRRTGGFGGTTVPSTVNLTLQDRNGYWNPSRTSKPAPYSGNIRRNKLVRLSCSDDTFTTSQVLGIWLIDDIQPVGSNYDAVANITASDALRLCADYTVDNLERPSELTGTRVAAILNHEGSENEPWFPDGVDFNLDLKGTLDTGTVYMPAATLSGKALKLLQECQRAEMGQLYTGPDNGRLNFRDKYHPFDATVQNTSQFTWTSSHLPAERIQHTLGAFNNSNRAVVSGESGIEFVHDAKDANTPKNTIEQTGLPMVFDGDAYAAARAWQKSHDYDGSRVASFQVLVAPGNNGVLTGFADNDIGFLYRNTITYTPFGWGNSLSYSATVEGISHSITPARWTCQVEFSPYETELESVSADWFTIGSPTIGANGEGAL